MQRRNFEETYPKVVRSVGLTLGVVLVVAPLVVDVSYAELAGGYTLATLMIFMKTVKDAGNHDKGPAP